MKNHVDAGYDISCVTAIRKIYYNVAPSIAYFSLEIVDGNTNESIDKLAFNKNNDEERKSGEKQLERWLEKIGRMDSFATITCEIRSGLGCNYELRIHVSDWQ